MVYVFSHLSDKSWCSWKRHRYGSRIKKNTRHEALLATHNLDDLFCSRYDPLMIGPGWLNIFQAHVSWVSSFFEGTIRWSQLVIRGVLSLLLAKYSIQGKPSLWLLGPKTKNSQHFQRNSQTDLLKNVFTWEVIRWSGSEWVKNYPHLFRVKLGTGYLG